MKIIESQCMSILMSELSERDKKESLKQLIYDEESKVVVENFIDYLIIEE